MANEVTGSGRPVAAGGMRRAIIGGIVGVVVGLLAVLTRDADG